MSGCNFPRLLHCRTPRNRIPGIAMLASPCLRRCICDFHLGHTEISNMPGQQMSPGLLLCDLRQHTAWHPTSAVAARAARGMPEASGVRI